MEVERPPPYRWLVPAHTCAREGRTVSQLRHVTSGRVLSHFNSRRNLMTDYMDEQARARDGALSHDPPSPAHTHPKGCACAGLDGLCPVRARRAEVEHRRQTVLDRSEAMLAAAAGETVYRPPRVLDAHEVLKQFEEPAG